MARKVINLKDGISALLSGIDLSNVADLYGAFQRAARVFVQKAKIPETQGTQNLSIYSGVTDYLIDTRIYGTSVMDIKPQGVSRSSSDFVYKKLADDFDRAKQFIYSGTIATFAYQQGTPIIRIVSSHTSPQAFLDRMSDTTGWVASGDASGLTKDSSFYYQSPASLRFNLATAGSQGLLTKTITSTDLSSYQNVGVAFLAIELPTASVFTSIGIKVGSSASNYYDVSNTQSTLGAFVSGQFLLIPFDTASATAVGSPDATKITYLQVYLNYDGTAQTNVRVGGLFIALPTPMQITYASAGFFLSGGVVSTSITTDDNEIILNDSAYQIYEYECALSVLQQTGGASADSMTAKIDSILNGGYTRTGKVMTVGLYDLYRGENPSEVLRASGSYYDNDSSYGNSAMT